MNGTPFGRYRLLEELGRGGMGEVWRAHDTAIDRTVAVKMLLPNFAQDEKFEARFRREARMAARLDNPHVVPIYDVGEIDGRLFVTMRLINGQDLQTLIDAGPLEPARAVKILDQVAKALDAAHKVGLIHRDIKPSNILVGEDDFAYLIDFGIARAAGETGLTSAGATIGTWAYMAPERFTTGQAEASSDIYALACVFYQCVTGQLPFPAVALEQIAVAHMTTPPPRASEHRPGLPAAIDQVVTTGLAKDPAQRYGTATALATAARRATADTTPAAPPTEPAVPPVAPAPKPAPKKLAPKPVPPVDSGKTVRAGSPDRSARRTGPRAEPGRSSTQETVSKAGATMPPPGSSRRRRNVVIALAAVAVVVVATAGLLLLDQSPSGSKTATSQAPTTATASGYAEQIEVPLAGLVGPNKVAVDRAGNLYVSQEGSSQILKFPAGSTTATPLAFPGRVEPATLAVSAEGAVYVGTYAGRGDEVFTISTGSPVSLGRPPYRPMGLAVDTAGNVYVASHGETLIAELRAGTTTFQTLPFPRYTPNAVAVDAAGALYASVGTSVYKLQPGSGDPTLLFSGSDSYFSSLAVDSAGTVYAVGYRKEVVALPAGAKSLVVLPFNGVQQAKGVAVDGSGAVYVTDGATNRVLKLPRR